MFFFQTIPKQQGAWSILISCFVLGAWLGGKFNLELILLLLTVLALFFGRYTASEYFKLPVSGTLKKNLFTWLIFYAGAFLFFGALLFFRYRSWFLVFLGAVSLVIAALSLYLAKKGKDLTLYGEISNILGLSLIAPAAEYTVWGIYSLKTFGLWMLSSFFFAGSVFRVRYFTRKRAWAEGEFPKRLKAGTPAFVFHLAAFLTTFTLSRINILPALAPFVLLPITLRVLCLIARRYKKVPPVRTIGYIELLHTLLFMVLAVITIK